MRLINPTGGATLGSTTSATLTISENDTPYGAFEFNSANFTSTEKSLNGLVTVRRVGGTTGRVTVNYSVLRGTASYSDFLPDSGTLTFNAGETTKSFNVAIIDDTIKEGNETVNLTIISPTGGATLGTQKNATLTINDND